MGLEAGAYAIWGRKLEGEMPDHAEAQNNKPKLALTAAGAARARLRAFRILAWVWWNSAFLPVFLGIVPPRGRAAVASGEHRHECVYARRRACATRHRLESLCYAPVSESKSLKSPKNA